MPSAKSLAASLGVNHKVIEVAATLLEREEYRKPSPGPVLRGFLEELDALEAHFPGMIARRTGG